MHLTLTADLCREAGLRAVPVAVEDPFRPREIAVLGIPGFEAYPEVTIFCLSVYESVGSPHLHEFVEGVTLALRAFVMEQVPFSVVEVL